MNTLHSELRSLTYATVKHGFRLATLPYVLFSDKTERIPLLPSAFESTYTGSYNNQRPLVSPDFYLGHRFPRGQEFVGQSSFIALDTVVEFGAGRRLILNLGDSSTSGWDSYVVTHNRELILSGANRLELPLFRYPTYSDLLRGQLRELDRRYLVINAGVPGYTSIQGLRHLIFLLALFRELGLEIAAVTLYFGNNDCTWNANLEDIDILPSLQGGWRTYCEEAIYESGIPGKLIVQRLHASRAKIKEQNLLRLRVSTGDYVAAVHDMIKISSASNILPIVIAPPIPLLWRPGERVEGEDVEQSWMRDSPGGLLALSQLERARSKWTELTTLIKRNKYVGLDVIQLLESVAEDDFLIPRIKKSHYSSLLELCLKENVSIIRPTVDYSLPEKNFFLDYCHPLLPINWQIAEGIRDLLTRTSPKNYQNQISNEPYLAATGLVERARSFAEEYRKKRSRNKSKSANIYPLY